MVIVFLIVIIRGCLVLDTPVLAFFNSSKFAAGSGKNQYSNKKKVDYSQHKPANIIQDGGFWKKVDCSERIEEFLPLSLDDKLSGGNTFIVDVQCIKVDACTEVVGLYSDGSF
jgi:hypothetical protein